MPREGDWRCPGCGANVFASKMNVRISEALFSLFPAPKSFIHAIVTEKLLRFTVPHTFDSVNAHTVMTVIVDSES